MRLFRLKLRGTLLQTDYILETIEKNYSEHRKKHTFAVCETAQMLARHYGVDEEKAKIAALFHDMFRDMPEQTLNAYVRDFNMDDRYYDNVNLAHGKIAAIIMERDHQIEDRDILNAVCYHTTGRPGMSLLEKIIYIADAIEPGRDYPGVEELRNLAYQNLDEACLLSMNNTIEYIKERGLFLDEDTIRAKNFLVEGKTNDK